MTLDLTTLRQMAHSPIRNYIVPGLTSWMIGGKAPDGSCMRMFEMTREQMEFITPHSHRFDFQATVLRGQVENKIWMQTRYDDEAAVGSYHIHDMDYDGTVGRYTDPKPREFGVKLYRTETTTYETGESYSMLAHQIHSIRFRHNTVVLMFEAANRLTKTQILLPVVERNIIPTFKVEPWMFQRETKS